MKKKVAIGVVVIAVCLGFYCLFKPDSLQDKVKKLKEDLVSYQLVGNMEINSQGDFKNYLITSSWLKKENQEYFKVSMLDKSLNQEQIILKNEDGVFVITPSLNQVFKFQGEWPMNSPKPYLLQTMLDILDTECTVVKENKGYVIQAVANYPSAASVVTQEIRLTSDLKPRSLIAYNADGQIELQMDFSEVKYNEPFEKEMFDTPKSSIETVSSGYTGLIELPLYPMTVFDSKLVSSTVSDVGGQTSHVLEFSGGKEFTVVQKVVSQSDDLNVQEIDGELVEGFGLVGYYNGNRLTVMTSQMETSIYSDELSVSEMLQVIESMQVSIMK